MRRAFKLTLLFTWLVSCLMPGPATAGFGGFDHQPLEIFDRHLFDLGTTDIDDDGDLDFYTTNHLGRQSILANNGAGQFEERLYPTGLAQTPRFPGWDDREGPDVQGPGLYISHDRGLHLQHVGSGKVTGSVEFLFPLTIDSTDASVQVHRDRTRNPDRYVARFEIHGSARIRLKPERSAHPYVLRIKNPFPLAQVFVGAQSVSPEHRRFVLYLRDRHGVAWGDFSGDGRTDAFIVRGGLRGRIKNIIGEIADELLLQAEGGTFRNEISASGIHKGGCRGRSAGAVDFNGDNRLDLFSTCKEQPPKLYRQHADGTFTNSSRILRRNGVDPWVLRWIDLDGDGIQEIVGVYAKRFAVFRRGGGGQYRRVQSIRGRHDVVKDTGLSIGDFDNDGDPDIYAPARSGSSLLKNQRGKLRSRNPHVSGLPSNALAGTWVDYDNDGRLDLHIIPGGLFRQGDNQYFNRTGLLSAPDGTVEARLAWPDLDLDGWRDAVTSLRPKWSSREFESGIDFNQGQGQHWLEVDLDGPAGNSLGIGGRVQVTASGLEQTQWVGQNESSSYSQGHYRLYFGLGNESTADLEVTWPDGTIQELGPVAADQLIELEYGG